MSTGSNILVELVNIADIGFFQTKQIAQNSNIIFPHEISAVKKERPCYRIVRRVIFVTSKSHRQYFIRCGANIEKGESLLVAVARI